MKINPPKIPKLICLIFLLSSFILPSFCAVSVKTWEDNSPTHNITLGNASIGLFNFSALDINDTLIEDEDVFRIVLSDFGYDELFSSYDSWGFYMNQTHEYFNGTNYFNVYVENTDDTDENATFIFYINPLPPEDNGNEEAISGAIDNITTFALQVVNYGFEFVATVLGVLVDNYSVTLAGLFVLVMLLSKVKAIPGTSAKIE